MNDDFSRHSWVIHVDTCPPLEDWSLAFGDFVHNLRSALDNLVYAIAIHEAQPSTPIPERVLKKLMFVVADDKKGWSEQHFHIESLSLAVRTAIKSVQPEQRPRLDLPPLLSVLSKLDNGNKHRLLNIAIAQPYEWEPHIYHPAGFKSVRISANVGDLVDKTAVVTFTVDPPRRDVQMKFDGTLIVSVAHPVGASGGSRSDIWALIDLLNAEVRDVIDLIVAAVK